MGHSRTGRLLGIVCLAGTGIRYGFIEIPDAGIEMRIRAFRLGSFCMRLTRLGMSKRLFDIALFGALFAGNSLLGGQRLVVFGMGQRGQKERDQKAGHQKLQGQGLHGGVPRLNKTIGRRSW
jgi:hypothetical protein